MPTSRTFLILALSCMVGFSAEPAPEPTPEPKVYSSWGKGPTGSSSARHRESRLDGLHGLKKSRDLDTPITVSVTELGRSVEGLEHIRGRIIDVQITNPNSYPVFFRGRQYRGNQTITPIWNKRQDGHWVLAGGDWCGTGVRDCDLAPRQTMSLMLYLHPDLKEQQILGRFFRVDDPSVQSDCLLYEKQ